MSASSRRHFLVLVFLFLLATSSKVTSQSADKADLAIWQQFVAMLRAEPLPTDRIRPYDPSLKAPLLGFLSIMRAKADWREWERSPEVFHAGERTTFVIPLTIDGNRKTY